jgi:hypothetical protein
MKNYVYFALAVIMMQPLLAAGANTNDWGDVACGAVMSLRCETPWTNLDTNSPIHLALRLKNVSDKTLSVVRTSDPLADLVFVITSPSGKNISPKRHSYQPSSPRFSDAIGRDETFAFPQIDFRAICELSEPGSYRLTVKEVIFLPTGTTGSHKCEIVSNPLEIVVK